MDEHFFLQSQGKPVENDTNRPGYRVVYAGGYASWSPKDVFEEAYRPVSKDEREMIA